MAAKRFSEFVCLERLGDFPALCLALSCSPFLPSEDTNLKRVQTHNLHMVSSFKEKLSMVNTAVSKESRQFTYDKGLFSAEDWYTRQISESSQQQHGVYWTDATKLNSVTGYVVVGRALRASLHPEAAGGLERRPYRAHNCHTNDWVEFWQQNHFCCGSVKVCINTLCVTPTVISRCVEPQCCQWLHISRLLNTCVCCSARSDICVNSLTDKVTVNAFAMWYCLS